MAEWILQVLPLWDRLITDWMVRGSGPGGGEIFCTRPDWPSAPPSPLYNWYRAVKWLRRDVDHQPPSRAEVKE